ncbi:hypothetical protein BDV59DRAFT_110430 [Aspergillus ambiguus]|uniref:uncharacterized protein n=1 Tax=Aspergillus ambiguus TaxID=176160 RepID=UPI003CCE34AD
MTPTMDDICQVRTAVQVPGVLCAAPRVYADCRNWISAECTPMGAELRRLDISCRARSEHVRIMSVLMQSSDEIHDISQESAARDRQSRTLEQESTFAGGRSSRDLSLGWWRWRQDEIPKTTRVLRGALNTARASSDLRVIFFLPLQPNPERVSFLCL